MLNLKMLLLLSGMAQAWDVTVNFDDGVLVSMTNVSITAAPFPAAVWLFGSALAGLGWMRRKQSV